MNRCLKMIINVERWEHSWSEQIQVQAKKLQIEGVMQSVEVGQMRIVVCGKNDNLDDFIDYLYDFFMQIKVEIQELEPFIKERDYRGTFRVI